MTYRRYLYLTATLLLLFSVARAHDYWIEPERFYAEPGASLSLRLFVGDHFVSEEERPLQKERTPRFKLLSTTESINLLNLSPEDGQTPIAEVTFKSPGNYLIAMERSLQTINLDAEKFTAYLAEEGLEQIIRWRRENGENRREGRERYTRYLKSLVQVGNTRDDSYKRVVGHTLEIIPEKNPYSLKMGESLPIRIHFEGRPLAGAKVYAHRRTKKGKVNTQAFHTDTDGRTSFRMREGTEWLIRLVHMRRCAGCRDIEWESFWAAYTFGVDNR